MKHYRVQTGFGTDDFIEIDETELETCIRAQVTGKVAITKSGTITGSIIQKIVPDWNKVMGYQRLYKLQGEDYKLLGRKVINEYRIALEDSTRRVQGLPPVNRLKGSSEEVKKLADQMNINKNNK